MTKSQEAVFRKVMESRDFVGIAIVELEKGLTRLKERLWVDNGEVKPESVGKLGSDIDSIGLAEELRGLEEMLDRLSILCDAFVALPKGSSRRASPPHPCAGCIALLADRSMLLCEKCAERVQHASIQDSEWIYKTLCNLTKLQHEPDPKGEDGGEDEESSPDEPPEVFQEEVVDNKSDSKLLHCDPGTETCSSIGESLGGLSASMVSTLARTHGVAARGKAVWLVNGFETVAKSYDFRGWKRIKDAAIARNLIPAGNYAPPAELALSPSPPATLRPSTPAPALPRTIRRSSPPSGRPVPALGNPTTKLLKP